VLNFLALVCVHLQKLEVSIQIPLNGPQIALGIPTGGDHFEADIAESVEDDHRVGPDTDPVAGLLGRSAAGVAGSSGAVELGPEISHFFRRQSKHETIVFPGGSLDGNI